MGRDRQPGYVAVDVNTDVGAQQRIRGLVSDWCAHRRDLKRSA